MLILSQADQIVTDITGSIQHLAPTQSGVVIIALKAFTVLLMVAGVIAVASLVVAGIYYLTAQGNEETVGRAKRITIGAVIGILLIALAYGLVVMIRARVPT